MTKHYAVVIFLLVAKGLENAEVVSFGTTGGGIGGYIPDQIVRLADGENDNEGRLEVYDSGEWVPVGCSGSDTFDDDDLATVVCRNLGLPMSEPRAYRCTENSKIPAVVKRVYEQGFDCTGTENTLKECSEVHISGSCSNDKNICIQCQREVSVCEPNPCINGECKEVTDGYECSCSPGYSGDNCETDIDDCVGIFCGNGYCIDKVNGYECECRPGHSGDKCEILDPNDPWARPLTARLVDGENYENEGRLEIDDNGVWTSSCIDNVDDNVAEVVCRELGLPMSEPRVYRCAENNRIPTAQLQIMMDAVTCTGTENNLNGCRRDPARNNDCNRDQDACVQCQRGSLEPDVDDCVGISCGNGECSDKVIGYECICNPGYTGDKCETDTDDCVGISCGNGECSDKVNGYECICNPGYTGDKCVTDINECDSNPCINHSDCDDVINGYECSCEPGYTGLRCEIGPHDVEVIKLPNWIKSMLKKIIKLLKQN